MNAIQQATEFKNRVKAQIGIAIAGAFAFVIALTWNDFIKSAVAKIVEMIGLTGTSWLLQLATAVIATVICVIGIIYFSRWGK